MFHKDGLLEIIRNFAQLTSCDLTVWKNRAILCTTRTDYSPHFKDWPIIKAAGKNPYVIYKSDKHACCQICCEVCSCPYEKEFFVPFAEPFLYGSGVCFQLRKEIVQRLQNEEEEGFRFLLNYTLLIENVVKQLDIERKLILLEQYENYLTEIYPGAVILLDEKDEVIHANERAKQCGVVLWDSKRKVPTVHLEDDKDIFKKKDFIFDKQRIGACLHSSSVFPQQNASEPRKPQSPLPKLIGISPSLQKAIDIAKQAARSDSTILIRGESGTGKEMFARTVHDTSPRSHGPFIAINCAAIPEGLLESELFGYEEGSFTGAKKGGKIGKIESANQGTLFLDEIGDMPLALQAKLLRVIQEKRIDRIGSSESVPVNIRLVAATHRNLEEMIVQGKFREDLYFRLNVIPIYIPPLRERQGDIELLLNFYLRKYCTLLRKSYKKFSNSVIERLVAYSWPGNIRELENLVEYLVNIHDKDIISIEDLPLHPPLKSILMQVSTESGLSDGFSPRVAGVGKIKKENLILLLNQWGWDTEGKKKVAAELGISIATLYRRLKKYKIRA